MSLEATVVCVDNSEWTRNGDFAPSRWQAQADAVNLLAGAKTQANPENTVGVLTMAGKTPRVLVTPTQDLGKVLNSMHDMALEGEPKLASAVQIAQLALKHRQNKNQRQRIVLFVGSPITETKEELVKIGKKLKKNNVAVDVVNFGAAEVNGERLEAFIEAVNSGDNSHLVSVPTGTILSDTLFGSPIYQQEGSGYGAGAGEAGEGGGGGGGGFDFGVDPNLDPELALALRVSLEEERARLGGQAGAEGEAGAAPAAAGDGATPAETQAAPAAAPASAAAATAVDEAEPMDEDALLQQALAMSMTADEPAPAADSADGGANGSAPHMEQTQAQAAPPAPAPAPVSSAAAMEEDEELDPELAEALRMSMQQEEAGAASDAAVPTGAPAGDMFGDADYLQSVLNMLPGVDPSDPAVQSMLRSLRDGGGDRKEDGAAGDKPGPQ